MVDFAFGLVRGDTARMFDPNLKAIEEEDYDKAKKRIMITSVIALILYAALTGWRYESTGRLKEGKFQLWLACSCTMNRYLLCQRRGRLLLLLMLRVIIEKMGFISMPFVIGLFLHRVVLPSLFAKVMVRLWSLQFINAGFRIDLEAGDTIVGSEVTEFFASSVWLEANYGVGKLVVGHVVGRGYEELRKHQRGALQ